MSRQEKKKIQWWAVAIGWTVALLAGLILIPVLRAFYGLFAEPPLEDAELTAAVTVISLISGFLAHVVGGYTAAKLARVSGSLNGAMTAVFGLIVGVILSIFGVLFSEGVAVPPVSFGLAAGTLLAGLFLFLVNLLGGYLGGRWGQPTYP